MMSQCRACEHCIVLKDVRPDSINTDVFECAVMNRAEMDMHKDCILFTPIKYPELYIESDLACDDCAFRKTSCKTFDVTNLYDVLDHFYAAEGNECVLENTAGLWDNIDFGDEDDEE